MSTFSDYEDFFNACHGLIFFGVPNYGLRHGQLRAIVKSKLSEKLIEDLVVSSDSEASPMLAELSRKFLRCCKSQKFDIVSFYETKSSPTAIVSASSPPQNSLLIQQSQKSPNGEWTRTGEKTLMVTEESATRIGLQSDLDRRYPLQTDHSGLVKFRGYDDPIYAEVVLPQIEAMVKRASVAEEGGFSRSRRM